jgi:ubiquinol-cytochrome c reductase cytochrome c subunit
MPCARLVTAVAAGVAALALAGVQLAGAEPAMMQAAAPDGGRELWLAGCAHCHGPTGGGTSRGPSIQGVGAAGVHVQVSTGRMPLETPGDDAEPGPVAYSDAEIAALVGYAGTIIEGPAVPEVDLAGADVPAGGTHFRTVCAACHQMTGQGGMLTSGHDVPPLVSSDAGTIVAAIRSGPNEMPEFPRAVVTDEAAADIAAYIQALDDSTDPGGWGLGHWGPVPEGAVALVLGLVPMVLVARRLGERSAPPAQEDERR